MHRFDYIENNYGLPPLEQVILKSLVEKWPDNVSYFQQWLSSVDFNAIGPSSFRMVPALFHAFQHIKKENPYYGRMKGIYCYSLLKNNLLFAKARELFLAFNEAKIDFVLFKGAALVLHYYKNNALRPMGDIDFLVHPEKIEAAEKIFLAHQLTYRYGLARRKAATAEHSFDYIDPIGNGYDLHWYALYESISQNIDQGIWKRARTLNWGGLAVKIMAPEDLIMTTAINGLRGAPSNMQCDWACDMITILQSEKTIAWDIIDQEINARHLTDKMFHALHLVHQIAPKIVPLLLLDRFLQCNFRYHANLLQTLISEGRTHGLDLALHKEIDKIIKKNRPRRVFFSRPTQYLCPKHIRCFYNEKQQINLLYLRYQYLPVLKEMGSITDNTVLEGLVQKYPPDGEGYVKIAPGSLVFAPHFLLSRYSANMEVSPADRLFCLQRGQTKKVSLIIENNNRYLWTMARLPHAGFAVSYHLLSMKRETVVWDNPRVLFLAARPDYFVFMEKGKIQVELLVKAPLERGKYIVQLDIVQEHVAWYSQQGNDFPELEMIVV